MITNTLILNRNVRCYTIALNQISEVHRLRDTHRIDVSGLPITDKMLIEYISMRTAAMRCLLTFLSIPERATMPFICSYVKNPCYVRCREVTDIECMAIFLITITNCVGHCY